MYKNFYFILEFYFDKQLLFKKEGFNNNNNNADDGNNNKLDLMETNRNLSAAMEKIELRCKVLEEKVTKYK